MKKSRKNLFLEYVENTKVRAIATNIFVAPTKKIDSGLYGKLFEMQVKKYLSNTNGKCVSAQGRTDTRKHHKNIEIKSGCSELSIFYTNNKIDLVVYAPEYLPTENVENIAYILTKNDFLKALEENNLIRLKTSSNGALKHTIQSFKNSNKKYNSFLDSLENYNIGTLQELRDGNI